MTIPNEAVEAAAKAHYDLTHKTKWVQLSQGYKRELLNPFRAALEAAAPHMLSHEREQTRMAHIDAYVNRDTADALQSAIDSVHEISNVRMNSEHGDPAFVMGWEAALEEVNARIKEALTDGLH